MSEIKQSYDSCVIVEKLDQCKALDLFFSENREIAQKCLIITTNPKSYYFLKNLEYEPISSTHFFTNDSHESCSLAHTKMVADLEENIKLCDSLGVQHGYQTTAFYYSQFLLSYSIWIVELLYSARQKFPSVNTVHGFESSIPGEQRGFISDAEPWAFLISQNFSDVHKIGFSKIALQSEEEIHPNHLPKSYGILAKISDQILRFTYIKALRRFSVDDLIFITTPNRNLKHITREIVAKHTDAKVFLLRRLTNFFSRISKREQLRSFLLGLVVYLCSLVKVKLPKKLTNIILDSIFDVTHFALLQKGKDKLFLKSWDDSIDRVQKMPRELISYRGVSFLEILTIKLKTGIKKELEETNCSTHALNQVFDHVTPKLVISIDNMCATATLGELCKKRGIVAILFSHGSHPLPKNQVEESEYLKLSRGLIHSEYPYIGVQSKLSEKFITKYPTGSTPVNTGPLIWGKQYGPVSESSDLREKLGISSSCKIVLHAGTAKYVPGVRFHMYETMDEYLKGIVETVHAVSHLEDVFLVVKFRPRHGVSLSDLTQMLPKTSNCYVSVDEPFLDVLKQSDLLISFSSTTMEEALFNKIPVLQYGGDGRLSYLPAHDCSPEPSSIERAPVYSVKSGEYLATSIRGILKLYEKSPLKSDELGEFFSEEGRVELATLLRPGQ